MLSKALLDTQEEEKRKRFNSRSQELVKHEERLTWRLPDLLVLASRSLDSSCLWRWMVRSMCFRCDPSQQEAHSCAIGVIFPNYIYQGPSDFGKEHQPWKTFPVTPGKTRDDGDIRELISGMTHHNCTAFISISLLFLY